MEAIIDHIEYREIIESLVVQALDDICEAFTLCQANIFDRKGHRATGFKKNIL